MTSFLAIDQGSLVGLCIQDYKSLCAAVMICVSLVDVVSRQTHTQTQRGRQTDTQHCERLTWLAQPAELETTAVLTYKLNEFKAWFR